jgi:hypothetical protein
MLMQTINLLALARPNLGGQGAGSVSAGGVARHYRRHWGGQLCRTRRRCLGRPAARRGGGRHSGGGAPEAGEDGAKEEDGAAAAEPRRPGQVREEVARVPGADGGGPAAWRGERVSADFGRPAAAENPVGQRTGAAAEAAVG